MTYLKTATKLSLMTMAILLLHVASPSAQFYFGKNKVQYADFDWQVMTTDHFKIYFYEEEREIAAVAAGLVEDSYDSLRIRFNHELTKKTPIIIYSSPTYFSQSNVIPGLLPESVGGFTEFMKGRVVVPFHGSYADFSHVLRHELVHVFTLSRLSAAAKRNGRIKYYMPPLWFTEGLAEFWSKEWDAEADMIVRDMVVNDRLFSISQLYAIRGTYFMYKVGESICHFIDSTYGSDKLARIFDNWHKGRNFDEIVMATLGDNLETLSRKWEYSLKKTHYPKFKSLGLPTMDATRITSSGYSAKGVPIRWDDGDGVQDWLIYKANRMGYSGLYMKKLNKSTKVRTLLKGERSAQFESLYLLRSGIDANDSGLIVFSSKNRDRDVIYLYDLKQERVTHRYEPDGLVSARSPRFSNDGQRIVFSGVQKSGYADLYILEMETGEIENLTSDIYFDTDPVFSLDNRSILFASDRGGEGDAGKIHIYRYDIGTGTVTQLTNGPYRDRTPEPTDDGFYFSSDRQEGFNLFKLDDAGLMTCQSTYVTGAFDPRVTSDGRHLVFTGYQDMQFQIFSMGLKPEPEAMAASPVSYRDPWTPLKIESEYSQSSIKYHADYSFDIAQSSIGYDPVYGSLGGVQAAMSDMLGNRAFYFLLTNSAQTKDNILGSFNFGVTFLNREKRLNWGVGLFHLYNEYYNTHDGYYWERRVGAIGLLSYPLSKFSRFDLTTIGQYNRRERYFGFAPREKGLVTHFASWVYDNSLWTITGPIEGRRYNLTVGLTWTIKGFEKFNRVAAADVRHYFRISRKSAFASRLLAYTSDGVEPMRIYLGGSWSMRGYDRREFYKRNVLFASHELRFPLVDRLLIKFPFGGLGFSGIQGALFFDAGSASDERFDDWYGSFGTGFRVALGYVVVLRFDFSRLTDFETVDPHTEFDFFFGWNF